MFQKIRDMVDQGGRFLVATHIDPDGDALGSAFALAFALKGLGKEASVYLRDTIPYRYEFLPCPEKVIHQLSGEDVFETVFVVDCGDLPRVGDSAELLKKGYLINIDHHTSNDYYGQLNIVDERASSTAEVLYLILKALDVKFSREIAVNLYTAILTDTGSFRYDSTTQRAFAICEEMMVLGVVPADVAKAVYENHPKERFHLLGLVLSTIETYQGDQIAIACVTEEMFRKTNTNREFPTDLLKRSRRCAALKWPACSVKWDHRSTR